MTCLSLTFIWTIRTLALAYSYMDTLVVEFGQNLVVEFGQNLVAFIPE